MTHQVRDMMRILERENKLNPEEYYLLGYNALPSVKSQPMFRRNILPPSSRSKNTPSNKAARKQEAAEPWTTRCYIPEGITLRDHRCEHLKSYRASIYCTLSSYELISFFRGNMLRLHYKNRLANVGL
jgi:hypothetical protein